MPCASGRDEVTLSSNHMQTLDLELLRTFLALAEHGTFARAGARTGRSQAAVSQQMQRLETCVGVALFEREGRTKQLTAQGRQLLRYARDMLNLNDEAIRALTDSGLSGSLRIGSPQDVADTILPPLLAHIARSAPRLRLDIHIGRSPSLMESLQKGEIDMTISTRENAEFEGIALRTSPSHWISAANFVLSAHQPLPLILIDEPSIFRRIALETLEQHHIEWRQAYGASSLIGAKAAVRAGLGITARGMEMLDTDMRVLGEKDGLPKLPDVTYHLWIRRHAANPVVREAYELIKKQFGPHGPRAT